MSSYVQDGDNIDFTATDALVAGTLVQIAGLAGILNPKPDGSAIASGDLVSARVKGIVRIPNSGVAFADGGLVGYDQSADEAVATTTGDFDIGRAVGAFADSTATVDVLLNAYGTSA